MPRAEGPGKGKGSYWTLAGGCASLRDLFEDGNYRRRRRRRGATREGARGARAGGAEGPQGPSCAPRSPAPRRESPPPAGPAPGKAPHQDIKFSIDYILSSPDRVLRPGSPRGGQGAQPTSLPCRTL